eukprot:407276-Amphidinium_carterae.2
MHVSQWCMITPCIIYVMGSIQYAQYYAAKRELMCEQPPFDIRAWFKPQEAVADGEDVKYGSREFHPAFLRLATATQ